MGAPKEGCNDAAETASYAADVEGPDQVPAHEKDGTVAQPNSELFLGLVGPVGTDLRMVAKEMARELKTYSYTPEHIGLSNFFPRLTWDTPRDFPSDPYDERTWAGMDAGDALRETWERDDALALLAIGRIEDKRVEEAVKDDPNFDVSNPAPSIPRRAYIIRSLKTPGEVRALRDVYGPRFFLIGAHCGEPTRVENLRKAIATRRDGKQEADWKHAPSQLIDRDWNEERKGGQKVSGTFHEADFFIDAHDLKTVTRDLQRVFQVLFGYPYAAPTREKYAMFEATGAARRSAELGRQVGAAITSTDGSILALGTNEVPQFGGGPYWEGDDPDHREYTKPKETNTGYRQAIASDIDRLLRERFEKAASEVDTIADTDAEQLRESLLKGLSEQVLDGSKVGEVSEYGRATHAEMSALVDAARRGVSVQGATLFTTTFPCHNCARHIIEAGIRRVVFVEPYTKSQALALHEDSMELSVAGRTPVKRTRVGLEPFVGVAPRRYLELFDALGRERLKHPKRKDEQGKTTDFDELRHQVGPVFSDLEQEDLRPTVPIYRHRERRVVDLLKSRFDETGLSLKEENA